MDFTFNKNEQLLLDGVRMAADRMDVDAYLVGGYVRDRLLHRDTNDLDIVVVGDGIKLAIEVSKILGLHKPKVYSRFGTAMLPWKGLIVEFVGARKESYSKHSRKPEVTAGTLQDDQLRRDFTVNAMAICLNGENFGELLDPFNGRIDLEDGLLRTPQDPNKTFSDDPLRMMRGIRFASQLNFQLSTETFDGISSNRQRISIVSQERITDELNKIILSPVPSKGFVLLLETGLGELVFPEFYDLLGVDYRYGRGHKDNFFHTLEVLDNLAAESDDLWLRWAAILHDIAKPRTKRYDPVQGWTFHGHEVVGARMVSRIFKRLRLPLDAKMEYVRKLVRLHLRPISLTKADITDSAVRRLIFDAGDDIDDLMLLCKADITTKNINKRQRYQSNYDLVKAKMEIIEEKDRLRNWQPPISGEVIMDTFDIPPSRLVGDIKTAIREAILDGEIPNQYQEAYDFMVRKGASLGLKPKKNP